MWQSVATLSLSSAALALFYCFLQILFIVFRYQTLVPSEYHPGFLRVAYATGLGHALNTFFPARAGDLLKAFLLSNGKKSRLTLLSSAGVLVADRIVDILTLLLMAIAWKSYQHPTLQGWFARLPLNIGVSLLVGMVLIIAGLGYFLSAQGKITSWMTQFRKGMLCLARPRLLLLAVFLAFLSWSAEALAIQTLCHAQGMPFTFGQAVFVVLALNIAISVPVSFANVGPFEAGVSLALISFGMGSSQALAVATLHHGIQMIAIGIWTGLALLAHQYDREG